MSIFGFFPSFIGTSSGNYCLTDTIIFFLTKHVDIALVKNNALVGARVAVALAELRKSCNNGRVILLMCANITC